MSENDTILLNRLAELSARADERGIFTYSEFLTLSQQDALLSKALSGAPVSLFGGYDAAERKIAVFGSEELFGWSEEPPVSCVLIEPVSQKFADPLTHRDFLGALMSLGIRREVLGDIIVHENRGYLFCLDPISEYIIKELTDVRHTTVRCSVSQPPDIISLPPEKTELTVASERMDALVAAVYRLSRSESQALFEKELVFSGGRLIKASSQCSEGAMISVRGHGRFLYEGAIRETKKGRLRVSVRIYK